MARARYTFSESVPPLAQWSNRSSARRLQVSGVLETLPLSWPFRETLMIASPEVQVSEAAAETLTRKAPHRRRAGVTDAATDSESDTTKPSPRRASGYQ
jgi:hypothetical protein